MGCQRNKKIYPSQREKLQKNVKGKRSANKNRKTQKITKNQNKTTDLLTTSKQTHYHKYFKENKKNYRALWVGKSKIVYRKSKNKTNWISYLI